jgi:hypothetical protein
VPSSRRDCGRCGTLRRRATSAGRPRTWAVAAWARSQRTRCCRCACQHERAKHTQSPPALPPACQGGSCPAGSVHVVLPFGHFVPLGSIGQGHKVEVSAGLAAAESRVPTVAPAGVPAGGGAAQRPQHELPVACAAARAAPARRARPSRPFRCLVIRLDRGRSRGPGAAQQPGRAAGLAPRVLQRPRRGAYRPALARDTPLAHP